MIDFHCHLDLYPAALTVLAEAEKRNAFTFVVTTSPRAYQATSRVFAGHTGIHVGLGLHPEVAVQKAQEEALLVQLVASAALVGEIGLDGSPRFRESLPVQERIFRRAARECELQGGRVMSIHSRGAEARVLDVLEEHPRAGTPVLHWFSGSHRDLRRAIDLGGWFSVGPAMLAGSKGRALAGEMPLDRLLPETDGPFAQRAGRALMPWEAIDVALALGGLFKQSTEQVQLAFWANLKRLLPASPLESRGLPQALRC